MEGMKNIIEAASWLKAYGVDNAYWEAKWLFDSNFDLFKSRLKQRTEGRPLQHILGSQPFRYLNLKVCPGVFIPRPETELLVEYAIATIRARFKDSESITFVDVGTGAGAIALSLVYELPNASGWAVDASELALSVAGENARAYGLEDKVNFVHGSLFDDLSKNLHSQVDLVISNPPYVCRREIGGLQTEIKDFEPHQSLDGGLDGLNFYREIVSSSPLFLKEDGFLALEIAKDQAEEVTDLIDKTAKFSCVKVYKDYNSIDRVVIAGRI